MHRTTNVKENFAALLRNSLKSRYGRLPSAAVLAREFNLRAYDTTPISGESARRWLRGVCLPEEERLRVLVKWLDLDFNKALTSNRNGMGDFTAAQIPATSHQWFHNGSNQRPNAIVSSESHGAGSLYTSRSPTPPTGSSSTGLKQSNGHDPREFELVQMIVQLPKEQQELIRELVKLSLNKSATR